MPRTPNSLNTYILPPLPQLDLPPLPVISDTDIKTMVFTHQSAQTIPKKYGTSMSLMEGQPGNSYEKLEFIGDSILEMVLATLAHELYPHFMQGSATILRSYLAANSTLAQISVQYNLPHHIICESSLRHNIKKSEKVQGSIFEAYIAGLYYSLLGHKQDSSQELSDSMDVDEPKNDPDIVVDEQKSAPREGEPDVLETKDTEEEQSINNPPRYEFDTESEKYTDSSDEDSNMYEGVEIIFKESSGESSDETTDHVPTDSSQTYTSSSPDESNPNTCSSIESLPNTSSSATIKPCKTRGEAYDYIYGWLQQVFTPVVHFAVEQLKAEEDRLSLLGRQLPYIIPPEWIEEDRKARGGKGTLYQAANIRESPVYDITREEGNPGTAPWKVVCRVTDIHGKLWTSEAIRMTKQGGMNAAAWKLCVQMGVIKDED